MTDREEIEFDLIQQTLVCRSCREPFTWMNLLVFVTAL